MKWSSAIPRGTDGSYSLPIGTLVNSGDNILPSQHNPAMQDIGEALSNSLDRNGSGGMRAPLDMGGNRVRNIGDGTNPTDAASVAQATASALPVGVILDYAGTTAPATYLLCFGQAVSRTDYADLFAVIGTAYGAGDSSTTFNIPDLRGRVLAGKDDMGGTAAARLAAPQVAGTTLGASGGTQTHTLTAAQMPAHNHGGTTSVAGDHTHTGSVGLSYGGNWPGGQGFDEGQGSPDWRAGPMGSAGDHSHTIASAGSGETHPNVQPTIIANKIIKARAA